MLRAEHGSHPAQIIAHLSDLTGIDLSEAFKLKSVDQALRWHTRYSRQNGVHVSPTFAVNGLVNNAMSSGQSSRNGPRSWRDEASYTIGIKKK